MIERGPRPPLLAAALALLAACPAPRRPSADAVAGRVLELGRPGAALAGVASRGTTLFASFGAARPRATSTIEAFASGASAPTWRTELAGFNGPLVVSGNLVIAALGGTGAIGALASTAQTLDGPVGAARSAVGARVSVGTAGRDAPAGGIELRGDPGAAIVGLDATTGAVGWSLATDATEWATISSLAATGDGVIVGGTFSGTLRIAGQVVSSAGRSDGFVARVTSVGQLAWIVRVGGSYGDSVAGVAADGDRVAIAGTCATGAELLGHALPVFDERSLHVDAFVAELDAAGGLRWSQTFGGAADEAIAGVAIDAAHRVVVAATIRDTVHLGGADHVARGPSSGLVAWFAPDGGTAAAIVVGGDDLASLRAITAIGEHVVVAGVYRGALRLGDQALDASRGEDAFFAELAPGGGVVRAWPIRGDGREEITALAALPGGFLAGVAHTAGARIDDDRLASPADPMSGAALVLRTLR